MSSIIRPVLAMWPAWLVKGQSISACSISPRPFVSSSETNLPSHAPAEVHIANLNLFTLFTGRRVLVGVENKDDSRSELVLCGSSALVRFKDVQ